MKAPFSYFGGKSRVAGIVWSAIGSDVPNYLEPFAGSAAVLLARPQLSPSHLETISDKDNFVANFWRATKYNPDAVIQAADWPVNEADCHARHFWLITEGARRINSVIHKRDGFDAEAAGVWLHGVCAWIGSGFADGDGPWIAGESGWEKVSGRGINRKLPYLSDWGRGINRKLPHLSDGGMGIKRKLPHLGNAGRGINRQLPHLSDGGRGTARREYIEAQIYALHERLRDVRVCCGDWSRILGSPVRTGKRVGIFIDPPYAAEDRSKVYKHDDNSVSIKAREWSIEFAREQGDRARVVFCGYADEGHCDAFASAGWREHTWSGGGYGGGRGGRGDANRARERIWMSPGCLELDSTLPGIAAE